MAGASSSDAVFPNKNYDVFISFGGKDTRTNFLSHLRGALNRKKIRTFMDEEDLKRGDQIPPALERAIEGSTIYVIILSENYASSSWCLNELDHILRCKEKYKRIVVPVFYKINPSDVRKQQNNYAAAFAAHELRFKDEIGKVQQWREDLKAVANLSGFHLSTNFRSEYDLVEAILRDILEKLSRISASDDLKGLIGIEKRVEKIESLLNIASSDVRIICLWGMGGIGKTTLARVVFNRIAHQFDGCCFLKGVREEGSKESGLESLQRRLFSKLLEEESVDPAKRFVRDRLRRTKVLVVLDDVDDADQLEYLVGDGSWFGDGSRIIVTSRDTGVLNRVDVAETYEVEKLNSSEAQQLFNSKAFRQNSSTKDYEDFIQTAVSYADGIPLALMVLGGHLLSKNTNDWKIELDKLDKFNKHPYKKVYNVLKVSYDGLDDDERDMFLDIAHFFKGRCQDFVEGILGASANAGIKNLRDKSLLTITKYNSVWMHDLLHQMGLEIVRSESKEPGERSRLSSTEDVFDVLEYNSGTPKIQGMSMDMSESRRAIDLTLTVFKQMRNLKLLDFRQDFCDTNKLNLGEGLESLPRKLRFLRWCHYPLRFLPSDFTMSNLVELHLRNSQLQHLWDGVPHFPRLKVLDLIRSEDLTQIPDLSLAFSLKEIRLRGCKSMQNLPSSVGKLESLQCLDLSYCSRIDRIPELSRNIRFLYLGGTSIEQVPQTIEHLCLLKEFDLNGCRSLKTLSSGIHMLMSLGTLILDGCSALESLPDSLEPIDSPDWGLRNLSYLNLNNTAIREIPDWVFSSWRLEHLAVAGTNIAEVPASIKSVGLFYLDISDCKSLQSLPELPVTLINVNAARCTSLETVKIPSRERLFGEDEELHFNDCIRLDCNPITRVFVRKALRKPIVPLFLPEVITSFPGTVIPEWFNDQNEGCSITMKLPPLRFGRNFMGFAACVVLAGDKNISGSARKAVDGFGLYCKVKRETTNGPESLSERKKPLKGRYSGQPHVFMWYFFVDDVEYSTEEISFCFGADDYAYDQMSSIKVERCGIRLSRVVDATNYGVPRIEVNFLSEDDVAESLSETPRL